MSPDPPIEYPKSQCSSSVRRDVGGFLHPSPNSTRAKGKQPKAKSQGQLVEGNFSSSS